MAGRARKAREHGKKMRDRRAAKTAKRQLYASLAGTSHKQKKNRTQGNFTGKKHKHLMRYCGNTGCATCFRIWPPGPRGRLEIRPDLYTRTWNT